MTSSDKKVLIVGLGLLGASLGLALQGKPYRRLGWARREETRHQAVAAGVVDTTSASLPELLAEADVTLLALPIPQIMRFLPECAAHCRRGSIVTDIGSVKHCIMECAAATLVSRGIIFIGGHPMAGTEKTGLENSFAAMYNHADVFICHAADNSDATAADVVKKIWRDAGAKCVDIESFAHDRLVAHTSHVPHILASALVLSVLDTGSGAERQMRFAGCAGGFKDTSRIASSSPEMWREIIGHNRTEVLRAMDDFEKSYGEFRKIIEDNRFDEFQTLFGEGRRLRDLWLRYKEK